MLKGAILALNEIGHCNKKCLISTVTAREPVVYTLSYKNDRLLQRLTCLIQCSKLKRVRTPSRPNKTYKQTNAVISFNFKESPLGTLYSLQTETNTYVQLKAFRKNIT